MTEIDGNEQDYIKFTSNCTENASKSAIFDVYLMYYRKAFKSVIYI